MVWEYTLPRCRLLTPIRDRLGHGADKVVSSSDPVVLSVNKESRKFALKHYEKRQESRSPCRYTNYSNDIFYFDHMCDFHNGGCCFDNSKARRESAEEMSRVTNIALRLRAHDHLRRHMHLWILIWISSFPNLENIKVVINEPSISWEYQEMEKEIMDGANSGFRRVAVKKHQEKLHIETEKMDAAKSGFRRIARKRVENEENAWTPPIVDIITETSYKKFWIDAIEREEAARTCKSVGEWTRWSGCARATLYSLDTI